MANRTAKGRAVPARKGPDESEYRGRCAARLRMLRERAGLTVEEVAEKAGITAARLYSWESGRAEPPLNLLPQLAAIYGIKQVGRVLADS